MLNARHQRSQKAETRGRGERKMGEEGADRLTTLSGARMRCPISVSLLASFIICLLLSGCRMDMQDQPKYLAYRALDPKQQYFEDGLSSRPLVEGTIPRGYLREDKFYFTGKMSGGGAQQQQQAQPQANSGSAASTLLQTNTPNMQGGQMGAAQTGDVNLRGNAGAKIPASGNVKAGTATAEADVNAFPFPITKEVLDRGQERYEIFCSMCHGLTGYGDGMIVRRGYRRPPSYHDDRLRQAPVGHFFDVITNGWGAMPDYSQQVPVQDRWAIIAYIRALQLSQQTFTGDAATQGRNSSSGGNGQIAPTTTTKGNTAGGGEHH